MPQEIMYPPDDKEYEDHVLDKVTKRENGYELHFDGGTAFFVTDPPIEPVVGDGVRLYGKGFGYRVRGCFIRGLKVFYRTALQDRVKHQVDNLKADEKKRQEWEETGKAKFALNFQMLPEVFQRRIKKFQMTNPDFDWDFGGYEMFCCTEALVIADTLKTAEKVKEYHDAKWDEQHKLVPRLSKEHSGNTHDVATLLAQHYLSDEPEIVVFEHGALTPLVGCKEYGCPHPIPEELLTEEFRERQRVAEQSSY